MQPRWQVKRSPSISAIFSKTPNRRVTNTADRHLAFQNRDVEHYEIVPFSFIRLHDFTARPQVIAIARGA